MSHTPGHADPKIDTPPIPDFVIPNKKTITYIWMPDAKGNLVKVESSKIKDSFASLPQDAVLALQEFLITVEGKTQPTRGQRQALWNSLINGAETAFKDGKKQTPWDVLKISIESSPAATGMSVSYTQYDRITSDATLNKIAKDIGFDLTLLTESDRVDFLKKISEEAKSSGKTVQKKNKQGIVETVYSPTTFSAPAFTESYLWAKVNLGDATKLPSKAITALTSVKQILRGNGIDYLSDSEVSKIAVSIASGKEDINTIKTQFADEASKYYPLLASRLKANPGLSVMDLLTPAVSQIAKWLEIDPTTIDLTNPYLDNYARPDGLAGKVDMPSMADFITKLKNSPESEKTTWKNEAARSAATSMASAMGYGI